MPRFIIMTCYKEEVSDLTVTLVLCRSSYNVSTEYPPCIVKSATWSVPADISPSIHELRSTDQCGGLKYLLVFLSVSANPGVV